MMVNMKTLFLSTISFLHNLIFHHTRGNCRKKISAAPEVPIINDRVADLSGSSPNIANQESVRHHMPCQVRITAASIALLIRESANLQAYPASGPLSRNVRTSRWLFLSSRDIPTWKKKNKKTLTKGRIYQKN